MRVCHLWRGCEVTGKTARWIRRAPYLRRVIWEGKQGRAPVGAPSLSAFNRRPAVFFFSRWNLQGAANWRVNLGKRPVLEVLHIIEHHDVYDSRGCHCNGKRTLPLTHPLPSVLRVTRLTELAIEHFLLFWISVTPVTACRRSTGTSKKLAFCIAYKERTFKTSFLQRIFFSSVKCSL